MSEVKSFLRGQLADAIATDLDRRILGMPVRTSRWLPNGTAIILSGEVIMARTTTRTSTSVRTNTIRVNVYDGPHHGRILTVPVGQRVFVLPNPMPAGLMFAKGRSNPSEFNLREYTYELRTPQAGGAPYLSFVETPRANFEIPPVPAPPVIRVSSEAQMLMDRVMNAGYNFRSGSNGTANERRERLVEARVALGQYISDLEKEAYAPRPQTRVISRTDLY